MTGPRIAKVNAQRAFTLERWSSGTAEQWSNKAIVEAKMLHRGLMFYCSIVTR